jgi:Flp pilus assembly protein TadG
VYVTWQNVFTSNANVTYNANTRTVTWNIGTLQGGKTVAADIQVSVRPSLSHVGTSPSITSGITLDAEELDSKARIKNTLNPLTTALSREVGGAQVSRVVSE